jgi:hypothetical protein
MKTLRAFRHLSKRASAALANSVTHCHAAARKWWRRSWTGRIAWPWLRKEVEIVLKVSGVIVLSLWAKRLVEQFLAARIVNERILQGELNGLVQEIEQEVSARRSHHGHRRTK